VDRVPTAAGPGEATTKEHGHPRAVFQRAIERENLLVAENTLREIGRVTLVEALQLTALIAVKDSRRHARVSARWLARWLEERDQATIDEAAFVTAALVALGGAGHEAAYAALLDVADRASRRPVSSGVA
jgi:hypothetical protein